MIKNGMTKLPRLRLCRSSFAVTAPSRSGKSSFQFVSNMSGWFQVARKSASDQATKIHSISSMQRSPRNVLGSDLIPCSTDPLTGWFRDGCCRTGAGDVGVHVVCARMTADFLSFSKNRGNDLSTPRPEFSFPGLNPGDQWCLCAARWQEAFAAGAAPEVVLEATHESALEFIDLENLRKHGVSS